MLSKNGGDAYIYTPHRVLGRTSGEDPLIHIDQEWGSIPRYQKIQTGTTIELLNPYQKQEPQVVIYVEEKSPTLKDPIIRVDGGGLAVTGEIQPAEYMKFVGGDTVAVYDNNWKLLRSLPAMTKSFTVNKGSNTVTITDASGSNAADIKVQLITLGPVYVLESNKHLKQNAEELDGLIYQAEAMKLDGYQVGESAAAAGGQCVATTGNGIAAQLFTGEEGVYTIVVYYFDESDGQSSYALRVDGEIQDSWVANDLRGSTRIDAANRARREIRGVTLSTGSLIEIASTANGSECGSLDQIVIIRR